MDLQKNDKNFGSVNEKYRLCNEFNLCDKLSCAGKVSHSIWYDREKKVGEQKSSETVISEKIKTTSIGKG